jgi:ATP-binding cassette subfamily B protein RaxB
VLENVSLSIDDGESICFVGPSGCGKTTLLKLLLGLYEPNAGKLYLGGREATNELLCAWRPVTASVMQNDSLLTGSIEQNIAFFDPQIDITRVKESARLACIDDEIEKMPMGYQSLIGDMGSALSGGQKQRILLARALYRKAKILFMDEGTANLDPKSEERIAETIQSLSITRVLVAHRPALIRGVDRVFMVKGGNVEQIDKTVFLKGNG